MKKIAILGIVILSFACNEDLVEKPDNLISKDKMIEILKEMAIVNAAKNSKMTLFQENNINPTDYVFKKFNIDSLQFVLSDKYYASKPDIYEAIYIEVDTLLSREKRAATVLKVQRDSIKNAKKKALKKLNDSLNKEKTRALRKKNRPKKVIDSLSRK